MATNDTLETGSGVVRPMPITLAAATDAVAAADQDLLQAVEQWLGVIRDRLDQLAASLDRHIEETEGADGLFASVAADAPHLISRIQWLTRDHDELIEAIDAAWDVADTDRLATDPQGIHQLHQTVHDLITKLHRHLHENCRITHDAVSLDLGVG